MRDPPWLDPRVCPGWNCSSNTTSTPRRASHQAVADPMVPAPMTTTSAFDGQPSQVEPVRPEPDVADRPDDPQQVSIHRPCAAHNGQTHELQLLGSVIRAFHGSGHSEQ